MSGIAIGKRVQMPALGAGIVTPPTATPTPGKTTEIESVGGAPASAVTQTELEERARRAELRSMLYAAVVGDVEVAARNFAIAAVAQAEDLKLSPETLPFAVALALDLAGNIIGRSIEGAWSRLLAGADALGEVREVAAVYSDLPASQVSERIANLAADIRAVPKGVVESGADKAVERGKSAASDALGAGSDGGTRSVQLAWISAMQVASDTEMTTLRDQAMPLGAPALAVWRLAWSSADHTQGHYTAQIQRALLQLEAVERIGLPYPWRKMVWVTAAGARRAALVDDVHGDGHLDFVEWLDDAGLAARAAAKTQSEHAGARGYQIETVAVSSLAAFEADPAAAAVQP